MNFINRAIKNVTRKFSKSILLIITFFVIGNFVIVGLGVSNAAENAKILTRQKMRAVVNYSVDYDEAWEYAEAITDEDERNDFYAHYPKVKIGDIKELVSDNRVMAVNAFSTATVYKTDSYDFVRLNNKVEESFNDVEPICWTDESGKRICEAYVEPTHFIKSNIFPNMIEFVDGNYEVVEGRFYNQDEIDDAKNVVLISKAFAEVNGLGVGDIYSFYVASPGETEVNTNTGLTNDMLLKDFTIIGIFDHQDKIMPDSLNFDYTYPYENPDNMLLMPSTTLYMSQLEYNQAAFDYYSSLYPEETAYSQDNRPSESNMDNLDVSDVAFLLNDPMEVDKFIEDYSNDLPQFMMLDANNEEFDRLSKPLDTLNLYSNLIIWLVVINAIVIISLVTALTLKTREYEIGVLLSIGSSKLKVIGQFFVELALVAVIGFSLSVVSGYLIANRVGQTVLEYQIQESEVSNSDDIYYEDYQSLWNNDYSTKISIDDLLSEYNVTVSPVIVGEIYILGLGIVLISILIPSMMIMRFSPKKILMNQN